MEALMKEFKKGHMKTRLFSGASFSRVLLAIIIMSIFTPVHAEEITTPVFPEDTNLEEVIVTATRKEKTEVNTPYSTRVISSEDLRIEFPAKSLPDVLKNEPGIMVQKTSSGQGSPYIRGFTGYETLMLIDGVRLNNSVFRDGPNQYWNTIDAFSLMKVELVRGPFSSLYGSDAVGGTVNAITRSVESLRPGSLWDRNLYYRYASAENSHIT
jgi:hemoglobin/transferrin/lactoferrin receptor protein